MRPAPPTNRRRITRDRDLKIDSQQRYTFIANQIAMATIATTITPHITGVTCFELPLRGESLAAWLNSCFMRAASSGQSR
jgi:hypothetical protein